MFKKCLKFKNNNYFNRKNKVIFLQLNNKFNKCSNSLKQFKIIKVSTNSNKLLIKITNNKFNPNKL